MNFEKIPTAPPATPAERVKDAIKKGKDKILTEKLNKLGHAFKEWGPLHQVSQVEAVVKYIEDHPEWRWVKDFLVLIKELESQYKENGENTIDDAYYAQKIDEYFSAMEADKNRTAAITRKR